MSKGGSGEEKEEELIPVVLVDIVTGEPLMLGYATGAELRETLEKGVAVLRSRKRGRWLKGETSGGLVEVYAVTLDCDRDAAAYTAWPRRHVCHLGRRSCFHNTLGDRRLEKLGELLAETWPHARPRSGHHPLATWAPPPSPLLAALAASLLAEKLRRARVNAVLAPQQPPPILAGLAAQRIPAELHLARGDTAPESIGEEHRVAAVAPAAEQAARLLEQAARRGAEPAAAIAIAEPPLSGGEACSLVTLNPRGDGYADPAPGTCLEPG